MLRGVNTFRRRSVDSAYSVHRVDDTRVRRRCRAEFVFRFREYAALMINARAER